MFFAILQSALLPIIRWAERIGNLDGLSIFYDSRMGHRVDHSRESLDFRRSKVCSLATCGAHQQSLDWSASGYAEKGVPGPPAIQGRQARMG